MRTICYSMPCFCFKIPTHRAMKAITADWVALEDEEDTEESEEEETDEEGNNFSEPEVFELY